MGVDITFKKMKKSEATRVMTECGAPNFFSNYNIPDDFNWQKFVDETEKYELQWFCGRHLIYESILEFPGDEIKVPNNADLAKLKERCKDITTKYQIHYGELLSIPVDVLKKYIAEAEKNEEAIVVFPLEDRDTLDYVGDDTDYFQAQSFLEDVIFAWDTREKDEIMLVEFSY